MKKLMICLFSVALLVGTGCDKKDAAGDGATAEQPAETNAGGAEEPTDEETAEKPTEEDGAAEKIEVAAAGQKFDPAIKAEQLPEGAWYCDMGTVHWAAMEKPEDGKCPECGMALKEYGAAAAAGEAKDDHPHEHGDGEHGHDDDHGHEH